jgi:hypothetical protein
MEGAAVTRRGPGAAAEEQKMRRPRLVILSVLVSLGVLSASTPAFAQYGPQPPPPPPPQGGYYQPRPNYYQPPPPPPGVQRYGLTFGGSLGAGSFDVKDSNGNVDSTLEGPSGELHIGGMITDKLGILLDGWSVGGAINDYQSLFHNIGTVSLRAFFGRFFWVQGGLGFGHMIVTDDRDGYAEESESGGSLVLGVGVEFLQTEHVTLDVSLRVGGTSYSNGSVSMGALHVGLNWY